MIQHKTIYHRLVIPEMMKEEELEANHNDLLAGHLGIKHTYDQLATKYYWKGMYQSVKEWISMCVDCAMRKGTPNLNLSEAFTIHVNRPFQIVGADILGPF